ncbi:MAG: pyridoxamine 5'-phosphate oxidase family protein [Eggerthellaceae bacterium]
MAALPIEVKALFEKVPTVVFATATADGQPNACIVGMKFVIDDETIYLSDQFFKKTLANVKANDKVAVVFWEGHDAYQIHGTARYVNEGEEFEKLKAKVDQIFAEKGAPIKAKGGVFVHIDEVFSTASGPHAGEKIA